MAPILEEEEKSQLILLSDFLSEDQDSITDEEVSLWIKEKDIVRPSTSLCILPKIEPGIYSVADSRDYGLHCRKITTKSDELFVFTDSVTNKLVEEINNFWEKAALYKEAHLLHKRGILLEGFPGTGKSSIITILSDQLIAQGGVVFKVTGVRNLVDYIDFIKDGFRKIQPDTPIITILEDLDQYADAGMALLDFLDGKTQIDHHIIIATSNNTEDIPDTFLRPSRIDLKIEVPCPHEKTREEYFHFKNVPEKDIKMLVKLTNKCSLADLKEVYICVYLLDYSIEDAVNKVTHPRDKKNYTNSLLGNVKIGL